MNNKQYDNIPDELKQLPNWVCWNDRKQPINARTGGKAMPNNSSTWTDFNTAVQAVDTYNLIGVGIVISPPYVAIDLDTVRNPETGEICTDGQFILDTVGSYTEISQSGTGFHIICRADFTPQRNKKTLPCDTIIERYNHKGELKKNEIEMYSRLHYFALTGNIYENRTEITEQTENVKTIHDKYMTDVNKPTVSKAVQPLSMSDGDILNIAMRDDVFRTLWNGGISSYPSPSEADLALCNKLAFYCGKDIDMMDRLFRDSALYRSDKWEREDYRTATLNEAIAGTATVYDPNYKRNHVTIQTITDNTAAIDGDENEWESPVPFDTMPTYGFPVESLPFPVAAFVEALSESTQTPIEMSAVLSLGVLATALQRRYTIEITPDWHEPLCLYSVVVAVPGERKSAVISALTSPVHTYEKQRRDYEAAEIELNRTEKEILYKMLEAAKNVAVKAKKPEERSKAKDEIIDLTEEIANFEDKHITRYLADDTTPEKLIDLMDGQDGCITVSSAEGGLFDALGGRYEKTLNLDVYLKGHAGDTITVDRIGRKSNSIMNPRLTMILTIQPEVLSGVMTNMTFKGRGLCGRFLYAICDSKVGSRNVNPEPISEAVKRNYNEFITRILSDEDTGIIRLSPEANKVRIDYAEYIEQRLGDDLEHMRDWAGKLVGAMLRIAALIHASEVTRKPSAIPVGAETIKAAIKISECLCNHAMNAYKMMGADETLEDAKYLLKRLRNTGKSEITKQELLKLTNGKFPKVEIVEPVIDKLIEMNYIKRSQIQSGKRGRPSEIIVLNPAISPPS